MHTEEEDIERIADARQQAAAYRRAARRAIALARVYRSEEGPNGDRERACVAQAMIWRRKGKPGLARARVNESVDRASAASR